MSSAQDGQVRAAVDIGGTFTDVQLFDPSSAAITAHKAPSTPDDPSIGLIAALSGAARKAGIALAEIGVIVHGSTIATNAVLERRLPRGALLTTAGFTDVLAIGRHMRRDVYALQAEPRPVLIPAERRLGVAERVRADGTVETALDPDAVRRLGHDLAADGVEAVAVVFLHAFRNPVHEIAAAEVLNAVPGLTVATSHETSPEVREYERASTTVLNALLKPVMSRYLDQVEARLGEVGITARLFLVQSNGGVATPAEAARLPVRMVLSGPSGGAMAMADLAARHDLPKVVGLDMGGTSTDVSVIQDGRIEETMAGEIDGLPVRLPMVEMRTIGAGGGSIARAEGGALRVGPDSAGARPGPACYGRGGTEPTVTDANLALGLIDPDAFLGGAMRLDAEAGRAAVAGVGAAVALVPNATAAGIVRIANGAMAGAVRLSLFEKGANPADFALAAFGGAAGLHACAIAEELEMGRVVFPADASTLSARGILGSDLRHDLIFARLLLADHAALAPLAEMVAALRADGGTRLARDGVPPADRRVEIAADMRYRGQAYEIITPWTGLEAGTSVDQGALDDLIGTFHRLHQARYAHSSPDDTVEIVAVRARAIGLMAPLQAGPGRTSADPTAPGRGRPVWMDGGWHEVPVRTRDAIGAEPVAGPLLVDEDYAVLWIQPGWSVRALDRGDLLAVRRRGGG